MGVVRTVMWSWKTGSASTGTPKLYYSNEVEMAEITTQTNVGIDVSKDWLDIVVLPSGETWRTENKEETIRELIEKLEQLKPERIVWLRTNARRATLSGGVAVVPRQPKTDTLLCSLTRSTCQDRQAGWEGAGIVWRTGSASAHPSAERKRADFERLDHTQRADFQLFGR